MKGKEVICKKYNICTLISCTHKSVHEVNDNCSLNCISGNCTCVSSLFYHRKEKLEKLKKL
jgi:hypothetical protein